MTDTQLKKFIEISNKNVYIPPKMEFSKKLILWASFFYGLMCIVAILSWFLIGEWPREVIEHFSWPFGAIIATYMCKSAYENKPKIEQIWKGGKF